MGRNQADFDSFTLSSHTNEDGSHVIASHNGSVVGYLAWGHDGEVNHVFVDPASRRQGIATDMWAKAHEHASRTGVRHPVHSDDQTAAGKAWASKTPSMKAYTEDEEEDFQEDAWMKAELKQRQRATPKERTQNRTLNSLGRMYENEPWPEKESHTQVLENRIMSKRKLKSMNQGRKARGKKPLPTYLPKKS